MSYSQAEERQFAFGDNSVNGQPCPLNAVGKDPAGDLLVVAEYYDSEAQKLTGKGEGVIDEETAAEAWSRTIDWLDDAVSVSTKIDAIRHHEKLRDGAREVQQELFS